MEELVLKAKKGDKEAFLQLIDCRLDVLYRIAYSYFKNKEEASDAIQDTMLIAFKSIKDIKDNGKFNSWITSILVNRCKEILRRKKKINFEELSEEIVCLRKQSEESYHNEYSAIEGNIDMLNLLNMLDDKYKEVIILKYIGDYSINEIANSMGIPEGTVKSRLNFGIKKLKSIMEVK